MSIPIGIAIKARDGPQEPFPEAPAEAALPRILVEARQGAGWIIKGLQRGEADSTMTKWAVTSRSQATSVLATIRLRLVLSEEPELCLGGAERAMKGFASAVKNWASKGWIGGVSEMEDYHRMAIAPLLQDLVRQTNHFRYMPHLHCKRMFILLLDILTTWVDSYFPVSSPSSQKIEPHGFELIETALVSLQAFYSANPHACQESFDELQASLQPTTVFERLESLIRNDFSDLNQRTLSPDFMDQLKAHPSYMISIYYAVLMQHLRIISFLQDPGQDERFRATLAIDDPEMRCRALEMMQHGEGQDISSIGRSYKPDKCYVAVFCYCGSSERGPAISKRFKPCSSCGMATYCGQFFFFSEYYQVSFNSSGKECQKAGSTILLCLIVAELRL